MGQKLGLGVVLFTSVPTSPRKEITSMSKPLRHLVLVLGDQLDAQALAFQNFDPEQDAVWMAEVDEESTHVVSALQRIVVFLSAMRHFAGDLRARGWRVHYTQVDDPHNQGSLAGELGRAIETLRPQTLLMTAPGEWRVLQDLKRVAREQGVPMQVLDDTHFFATVRDFAAHAKGRKQLRLEYFYREMRRKHRVLMDGEEPVGGQWNFDEDNRRSFGKDGPGVLPAPTRFEPDATTQTVIDLVQQRFAHHPGRLSRFGWPVTRAQALQVLSDFVQHRLPHFGPYQDAMWAGEVWLYHSHLSVALNLKLLNPREVVAAAESAWQAGRAPLASVEGLIRQILGWREYVRGVYWTQMPDYAERNAMNAQAKLPDFYWTGQTDMACLRDAIELTLEHSYAHHIQRLMVTGLYALLLGVKPQEVHAWYLGVYADAVEWVELPNTLGMSQYADGGIMASKPYVASGQYIDRMSNHCKSCRFKPKVSTGADACPFTTLYWDYLQRHQATLVKNPRMSMALANLKRFSPEQQAAIATQALALRDSDTPKSPIPLCQTSIP
jgi:deoxyribodipyrimidine photolyase-related protein